MAANIVIFVDIQFTSRTLKIDENTFYMKLLLKFDNYGYSSMNKHKKISLPRYAH